MPFNRFQKIRAAIHFYEKADEALLDTNDRFRKVSILLQHMKSKCNGLPQENSFAIDETMVPYKGKLAGNLRQYIQNKPHKFGFKMFSLAGKSGIIYDFFPYVGSKTFEKSNFSEEEAKMGVGARVVIQLVKSIDNPALSTIYFDNYFSSVELISYLKEQFNTLAIATIRSNRIDHCPLMADKEMKKSGRGTHDSKIKNGIQIIKWFDNRCVHVVSSLAGVQPIGNASRYDKKEEGKRNIPIPRAVELDNANMGPGDLHDMLVELYRTPTKARRWYIPLVAYMIDLAVVNSWLLYRRHCESLKTADPESENQVKGDLKSKAFKIAVSKALIGRKAPDNRSGSKIKNIIHTPRHRPDLSVSSDGINHWPNFVGAQGRCKYCADGFTTIKCLKCNLHLCLRPKRNCFVKFHSS